MSNPIVTDEDFDNAPDLSGKVEEVATKPGSIAAKPVPAPPPVPVVVTATAPVRVPAMPLEAARSVLAKTLPIPSDPRRAILNNSRIISLAGECIVAAQAYRAVAKKMDKFTQQGARIAMKATMEQLHDELPSDERMAELLSLELMSAGGSVARAVENATHKHLRVLYVAEINPRLRALHDAVKERADRLIATVEASERAFDAALGLPWTGGRACQRLMNIRSDLLDVLSHYGRPVSMHGLGFTELCKEIMGNHQPLLVAAFDGKAKQAVKTQLAPACERGWFAVENLGTKPVKVSVGSKWTVVEPGQCKESRVIALNELDSFEATRLEALKGKDTLLNEKITRLIQSPIVATTDATEPVEVVLYEGNEMAIAEDTEPNPASVEEPFN